MKKWSSQLDRIGIVVPDMERQLAKMRAVFEAEPDTVVESAPEEQYYYGKRSAARCKKASFSFANVELEVIAPLEGESAAADFLRAGHRGLAGMGFAAEDMDAVEAEMAAKGIRCAQSAVTAEGRWACYDLSDSIGGMLTVSDYAARCAREGRPSQQKLRPLAETPIPESAFTRLEQIGFILPELDRAVADFRLIFDEEPENIHETRPAANPADKLYYGEPSDFRSKIAMYHFPGLEFEMIVPQEGKSTHRDFLNAGHKGINHVAFGVKNIAAVCERMAKLGYRQALSGAHSTLPGGRWVYFDAIEDLGFLIEVTNFTALRQELAAQQK